MIERLRSASARGQRMTHQRHLQAAGPRHGRAGRTGPRPGQPSGPGSAAASPAGRQTPGSRQRGRGRGEEEGRPRRVIGRDSRHKGRTDKGRQDGPARRPRFGRHRHGRPGRDHRAAVRLPPRAARGPAPQGPSRPAGGEEDEGPGRDRAADHRPQPVRSDRHEGRRTLQAAPQGDQPALRHQLGHRLRRRRRSSPSRRTSSWSSRSRRRPRTCCSRSTAR